MELKPQDILALLKIHSLGEQPWTYASLADSLFMSASEVHAALKRAAAARLMDLQEKKVRNRALLEFLVHGVKYAYPPHRGAVTRGMPTAFAALPLSAHFPAGLSEPPVWPTPEGSARGTEFSPLYSSVPKAAARDPSLYELLALVDAIRDGQARETELATVELTARMKSV